MDTDPGRISAGTEQTIVNNQFLFASYRFLFTARRGRSDRIEYGEIELKALQSDQQT